MLLKTIMMVGQILSALGVIGLVLVQHGKGADMGAAFGGGASGSLFGASGSANFLSRATAVLAAFFFVCTLALTFLGSHKMPSSAGVLSTNLNTTATTPATVPAGDIPAAAEAETNQEVPK